SRRRSGSPDRRRSASRRRRARPASVDRASSPARGDRSSPVRRRDAPLAARILWTFTTLCHPRAIPGSTDGIIDPYGRKMICHAAAVIWLGLMSGFPFGFVIMGRMEGDLRAWHMAHMEGILNGLLTLAAAAVLKHLAIDERRVPLYAWSFIVAAWTNIVA